MSRHDPASMEGTTGAPLWWSLATLPARLWLAGVLWVLDPPPSAGVLARLSRWRPQGRRGRQCGRR